MKKEVFLAISIGFILGLIITFGIWTANKSLKNLPTSSSPTPQPTTDNLQPTPTPNLPPTTDNLQLIITSPQNEALLDKSTVTVTGKAPAGTVITILSEAGQTIVTADSSGNFSSDVSLEGGYNRLVITAIDKDGKSTTQNLTATYTTAKI